VGGQTEWPIRLGAIPPLADAFTPRPQTAPALGALLVPGATVALVPDRMAAGWSLGWLESCGKTQLAVSFAESLWRSRQVDLLIWVCATSPASVLSGYAAAAAATIYPHPAGDAASAGARFVAWLGECERPWLVVLDDLSDAAEVAGLWPEGPAGRVLITTRSFPAVSGARQSRLVPVGAFSPREALSYMTGRLGPGTDQTPAAMADLAHELCYEPLALAQASAVIASSALSCRDYQQRFAARRGQLAEAAGGDPAAASATWTLSADEADRLSPDGTAQALQALAALLDGHGVPGAVLTAPAACEYLAGYAGRPVDPERAGDALLNLERAGLLALDVTGGARLIRMSSAVQAAVRAVLPDEKLGRAGTAAADALLQAWPRDDRPAWLAGWLRSSAASLQRTTGDLLWTDGCHPLLSRVGRSMDSARLTGPAIGHWKEVTDVSYRVLGRGDPDTLAGGAQLARAYLTGRQAAQAVTCLRSVLAERIRILGPDHPSAIATRRDLGQAVLAANQLDDAIAILERVADDCERVRGAEHPDTFGARDDFAAAYRSAGRFADAIRLYELTLADRERVQGPEHADTLTTRQKLAEAYLADGCHHEALSHYKRVLSGRERLLGPDHLDTIEARGALGSAYLSAGRTPSALQFYENTRRDYRRVLGADHPDTLTSCVKLARAYQIAGRPADAKALLRDASARCARVLPPGDPLTLAVADELDERP
jgi:tetratricopeptide (TPR) repeat protein